MIAHIRHSYRPSDRLVTYEAEQARLHALDSDAQAAPGLLIYRFGANLVHMTIKRGDIIYREGAVAGSRPAVPLSRRD